jgi:UDP-N-acetylglucosamine diphosphorylase/glucosamine-1-phosphate N-acetyltransferase
MRERWEKLLGTSTSTLTATYLQPVFPGHTGADTTYINGAVFGSSSLADAINTLQPGHALSKDGITIAARTIETFADHSSFITHAATLGQTTFEGDCYYLNNTWDIFSLNERAIKDDFTLLTAGRTSALVPVGVTVTGHDNLFIEEGAKIYAGCIINAAAGPVYIAKDAEVLEGTMMRGPIALCEHSVVKMGAKLYGATTIGPGCKVGGEINNSIFFANSNKAHDGYLGNSVIGEWCNLGADTNTSNLKNNYDVVKVWDEANGAEISTGLIFCGLMMGDHSKCGINTMFNTGTVAGVACNIYGGGFPAKRIPSFSWGGSDGLIDHRFDKAMETANRMMGRRGKTLSPEELAMYKHIYDHRS